jgi:hypothetical protein
VVRVSVLNFTDEVARTNLMEVSTPSHLPEDV